jgi:predicted alpha/beta hydrolase
MPHPHSPGETLEIEAPGARLSARFFPAQGQARAHLVLHGASAVPQAYYIPFANWAAAQGVGVLTYDYRDFGASQHRPLRESPATMADWALRDQAAAEAKLAERVPEGPLWLLGHSLGGLGFVFRPPPPRFTRIITAGAGRTHISDHPWRFRTLAIAFWFLLGPAGTALRGYLPGKSLLGADLPAGVFWQWRRWCTHHGFYETDIGKSLPAPDFHRPAPAIEMVAASDDVMVPPGAVRRYAALFAPGRVSYRELHPQHFGLKSLRHIEMFSARNEAAWPAILTIPPTI